MSWRRAATMMMHIMVGKIAVSQIQNLTIAYKERFDRNNFFQNLILDNLLLVDIYNRAQKLHIEVEGPELYIWFETRLEKDSSGMELFTKPVFSSQNGDCVFTAVDEKNIILIKAVERDASPESLELVANTIVDMMNSEAMLKVRVSYGTVVQELRERFPNLIKKRRWRWTLAEFSMREKMSSHILRWESDV